MGKEKKKKRNSGREENEVWGNCLQQQKGIRGNEQLNFAKQFKRLAKTSENYFMIGQLLLTVNKYSDSNDNKNSQIYLCDLPPTVGQGSCRRIPVS